MSALYAGTVIEEREGLPMSLTPQLFFASFRLDPMHACLWHDAHVVTLRPKTFRVLQYLLEHAGQLVTKEELLQAAWPETAVSDAVLKVCIGELRKLLHETIREPQFITTVHRRGYRFIGKVKRSENGLMGHPGVDFSPTELTPESCCALCCHRQGRRKAPTGVPLHARP
jgi:DNA-binding winged helix-turn-helix (wHTH) protein